MPIPFLIRVCLQYFEKNRYWKTGKEAISWRTHDPKSGSKKKEVRRKARYIEYSSMLVLSTIVRLRMSLEYLMKNIVAIIWNRTNGIYVIPLSNNSIGNIILIAFIG